MKRLRVVVVAVLITCGFGVVRAQQPKPAWKWTVDERLRERFDSQRAHERLQAAKMARAIQQVAGASAVIDGARNPELFVPLELFDALIDVIEKPVGPRDAVYATFRVGLDPNWNEQSFWRDLETLTEEYRDVLAKMRKLQNVTAGHAADLPEWRALTGRLCAERVEALARAQREFGTEAFNKFLYVSIAPGMLRVSRRPDNPATFRSFANGGCE